MKKRIDWNGEALKQLEWQKREAERERLLRTGSLSDASEAFGHNAWALNAYLSQKDDVDYWKRWRSLNGKKQKSTKKEKAQKRQVDSDPELPLDYSE